MIHIENLRVVKAKKVVCSVARLQVEPLARLAIVGPNGSGKTTLLRVLAGLERDYAGTCDIAVSMRQCVYVHQSPLMFRGTVLANITYGLAARGVARRSRRDRAEEMLAKLDLSHLADRDASTLSGGETRRAAIARALVVRPTVLLLDEPFADLDEVSSGLMREALTEAKETTVVVAVPMMPKELAYRSYEMGGQRLS